MYVEKGPRPVADLCQPAPPHTTHNGCPADSTRPHLPSQVVQSGPGPPWTARGYITSAIIHPGPLTPSFSTVSPVSFQAAQAMSAHVASTTQWVQSCSSCCCGCSCCSHCFPVEICCRSPCSTVDLMFSHMRQPAVTYKAKNRGLLPCWHRSPTKSKSWVDSCLSS